MVHYLSVDQRKLLCIYVLLNTLCRWLTVMDITLCPGFSTDGTTLCCRHVSNSWQSTLKKHTCCGHLSIWSFPLLSDIGIQHICEPDFVTDNTHDYSAWFQLYQKGTKDHMTNDIKNACSCIVCTSTQSSNLTKIPHKKSHQMCILICV